MYEGEEIYANQRKEHNVEKYSVGYNAVADATGLSSFV